MRSKAAPKSSARWALTSAVRMDAEVVAESDADAGLLARLGFRAGTRGRHGRSGDRGRLDAGDAGFIAAVIILPCRIRIAGLLRRHVLGPDQALDDLQLAVPADGGDASGDCEILVPERGPRFDRGLDLLEPGLDGVGFGHEFLGPRVVVHVGELVVTGPQALALGLLLAGGLSRLRIDPAEAGEVGPVDLEARLGPLPAGRELVRRGLEALGGELVQEIGIFEPDAPLVLVGEQVAVDPSAGRLVSLDSNEVRGDGGGGNPVLGEHAFDLPAARPVALVLDLLPHRHLSLAVGGDGEGLEGIEIDLVGTVGVEKFGRGVAEPQAPLDGTLRHAEAGGDAGDGGAVIGQRPEGLHLVGRVHGNADHVLGEGEFVVGRAVADDAARDGEVGGQHALAGEGDERGEPSAAGDDGVAFAAVHIGVAGADHQVLQQPVRGDGSLEFGEGGLGGHGLADVGGREFQPVERDGSGDGIGHVRSSPERGRPRGAAGRWSETRSCAITRPWKGKPVAPSRTPWPRSQRGPGSGSRCCTAGGPVPGISPRSGSGESRVRHSCWMLPPQRHPGHGSRPSWPVSRIPGTIDAKSGVMRYSSSPPSSPGGGRLQWRWPLPVPLRKSRRRGRNSHNGRWSVP